MITASRSNFKKILALATEKSEVDWHTYYPGDDFWMVAVQNPMNKQKPFVFWVNGKTAHKLMATEWDKVVDSGNMFFPRGSILFAVNTHIDDRLDSEKRIDEEQIKRGEKPTYMPLWMQVKRGLQKWDDDTKSLEFSSDGEGE